MTYYKINHIPRSLKGYSYTQRLTASHDVLISISEELDAPLEPRLQPGSHYSCSGLFELLQNQNRRPPVFVEYGQPSALFLRPEERALARRQWQRRRLCEIRGAVDIVPRKAAGFQLEKDCVSLRGNMLKSKLYGRSKNLCSSITDDVVASETDAECIVKAIYKRDSLSVVSEVYGSFVGLLQVKRGNNESLKNLELQFDAQASKFSGQSGLAQLPETLTPFILLANSVVDNGQRVSVFAAASSNRTLFTDTTITDYISTL
eukprot:gb/GEZJ01003247.1/.p1 GENE.gb/GEZJ01003247.1/~~gb/GEZJ01003247.1/.p1  ORF type:complete len:261 (+),score=26.29 gb/GEZJ01003247.1/:408-1190(+)